MLQRIAAEKTVDVYGFVMSLRRDRNRMVQVEEQYVFIHDVLQEAIHSGYTEIKANDLRVHIKTLMQVNTVSGEYFPLSCASCAISRSYYNMQYLAPYNAVANDTGCYVDDSKQLIADLREVSCIWCHFFLSLDELQLGVCCQSSDKFVRLAVLGRPYSFMTFCA